LKPRVACTFRYPVPFSGRGPDNRTKLPPWRLYFQPAVALFLQKRQRFCVSVP
jgi:hypothetical protein